jgi:hypothetical protein
MFVGGRLRLSRSIAGLDLMLAGRKGRTIIAEAALFAISGVVMDAQHPSPPSTEIAVAGHPIRKKYRSAINGNRRKERFSIE